VSKRWLRLLLGLLLSAGALWLATRGVDWAQTGRALRTAHYPLLLVASLVQCATYLIGASRWRVLFPDPASIPLGRLIEALLVAQLVNTALPLRLGPLARAYLVGERHGQGKTLVLTTVAGEKLAEALALVFGIILVVLLLPIPGWLRQAGMATALLAATGLVVVLVLTGGRHRLARGLARLGNWVTGVSVAMLDTMAAWSEPARAGRVLWWTALLWLLGVGVNLLVLLALGMPGQPLIAFALLVLLQLGARVPGAPANLGIFESVCVLVLGWFGIDPGLALSYGFALHVVVLLPGLIGGAWVLWHDSAARAGLQVAASERPHIS
jgi:uncharacterized membrane protein YbhN (UPF0104 family)